MLSSANEHASPSARAQRLRRGRSGRLDRRRRRARAGAAVRAKNSLDGAGEVARDLAASVEYFEAGQAYYRAYAKGTHSAEENAAFVKFLEDYEKEQLNARRTHAALGQWLERKSKVTD
jgi:hypothetical protein